MLFFAVLLLVGFWRVQACERGLTQLRYPKTLELIRCTPGSNGDDDPCWSLAKNNSAQCQLDKGGEHVCCGTTNLLIQLLANTMITRRLQEHSLLERTPSPPFLRVFSNGIDPDFLFSSRSKPFTHTDYKSNYGSENQWFEPTHEPRINVVPALPKFHLTTSPEPVHNHIQEEISIPPRQEIPIEFEGPTVTLLATGKLIKGSDGGSYLARSTVVLVQDGNCRIVVNTGMPSQVEELKLGLTAIGLSDPIFDFTVINSNLPPYIGNLNLFKSNKLLLENTFEVESDTFRQFPPMNDPINLCSPQVQLLFTPGATNDGTTVLVRNVPSMGTVAVVGALFLEDDNLARIDPLFTSNQKLLLASRKAILCQADWLIPGHSSPIQISGVMKQAAGC